jgi:BirA family biotin operon repressor/biotin-[acetyl-CoA-carboxylase] ligase
MTINWTVETFAVSSSTQDEVKDRALDGADEGLVIQALTQTQGRGRRGNEWTSPMGNLYMSVLLRPLCTADLAGQISFIAALAVSAAMDEFMVEGHTKTLKWPNDILIDGKKCAGILLESELSPKGLVGHLVIGMGVNILSAPDERIGLKAVSGENRLAVHPFRDRVLHYLDTYYTAWKAEGFGPIRKAWLAQAHGLNQKMTARLPQREEKGIFRDLDDAGGLILELSDNKQIVIRAGEIYFEEPEAPLNRLH